MFKVSILIMVLWFVLPLNEPTRATTLGTQQPVSREVEQKAEVPSAKELLQASDSARGGDIDGLVIRSTVTSYSDGKEQKSYGLQIESDRNNTLAIFLSPPRSKGVKMLMQQRNMWFLSPEVSKPVPISPRQRLLGEASNGDIATTNYSRDYDATIIDADVVQGIPCYVLSLKAKSKNVTYDKIIYYIAKESKLGLKSEYYTVSDKRFKTAYLEYNNVFKDNGKTFSFVSRMEIIDELNDRHKTILTYSDVESKRIPPSRFDKMLLMQH